MPGMDSKILVAVELLVLVCLFSLESASCSTKGFQITRDSRDSFKSKARGTSKTFFSPSSVVIIIGFMKEQRRFTR